MILAYFSITLFFILFIVLIFYVADFLKKPLPNYEKEIQVYPYAQKTSIPSSTLKERKKTGKKAYVFCTPEKTIKNTSITHYMGFKDCTLFKQLHESELSCSWSCIGFGSCISYCPREAIIIKNNTAVITENCDGCGLCIDKCPNNVIKLIPNNEDYIIPCSSHDGKETDCSKACTGCELCTDTGFFTGFIVKDGLAKSDYISNPIKASYVEKCPQECIIKTEFPRKNDFQFLKLWYTIKSKIVKERSEH